MELTDIPFGTTDWLRIEPVEHAGQAGVARWRTRQFGAVRVRLVEYTPGYQADPSSVEVVDLATQVVVDTIPAHLAGAVSGAFSEDGSILTVGTWDGFEVIDVASKASLGGTAVGYVGRITHHPSKPLLLASTATGVYELDEKSGAIVRRFAGDGYDAHVVSPDGTTLYAVAFNGAGVAVWNLETGAPGRTLRGIHGNGMAISSDGRFLYVIRGGYDFDNRLRIVDVASGAVVRDVSLGGFAERIALSSDGTAIISNSNSVGGEPGWVDFIR